MGEQMISEGMRKSRVGREQTQAGRLTAGENAWLPPSLPATTTGPGWGQSIYIGSPWAGSGGRQLQRSTSFTMALPPSEARRQPPSLSRK